jgi:hypothetical protein
MKNKEILEVYCIGSIPVDSANLYFYDLNSHEQSLIFNEKNLEKNLETIKKATSSLNVSCFADGAYPCYVAVDQFKHVKKIFVELNNTCGWGSSIFENKDQRKKKLETELQFKQKAADGFQLDMVIPARVSVEFGYGHRLSYSPWSHFNFLTHDNEFLKIKGSKKTKLCDIDIKSDFLVFDDYPDLNANEKKIIKKEIFSEIKERIVFCLKNKKYPVYIYNIEKSLEQKNTDIAYLNNVGLPNPYFPILSIEKIEGCKLEKSSDGKLIFKRIDKKNNQLPSDYFLLQLNDINKDKQNELKICQLDLFDFQSLDALKFAVEQNKKVPKTLVLRHLKHIHDWSVLFKFFDIKTIKFDNCELDPESNKKNSFWDCITRISHNRKNNKVLNEKFGEIEIFVNGNKLSV